MAGPVFPKKILSLRKLSLKITSGARNSNRPQRLPTAASPSAWSISSFLRVNGETSNILESIALLTLEDLIVSSIFRFYLINILNVRTEYRGLFKMIATVHGGVNINYECDPTFMKKIESPGMLELLFLAQINMN